MLPKAEAAYFAIADISGYTSFLAAVELDHAQDIIADFMDTVVKGLRPPFRLAKFEGDAAFVYDGREGRRLAAAGRDRGRLFQIPPAAAQCSPGLDLRVPGLRRDGRSRFQVRRPSRRDGEAEDGRERRARRARCHSRPPAAQERGKREDRRPRLCALQRRGHTLHGRQPGGARCHRASRNHRRHRRRDAVGARSRSRVEAGRREIRTE